MFAFTNISFHFCCCYIDYNQNCFALDLCSQGFEFDAHLRLPFFLALFPVFNRRVV